jgi:hypothetical protein
MLSHQSLVHSPKFNRNLLVSCLEHGEMGVVLRTNGKSRPVFHVVNLEKAARLAGESFAWEDSLPVPVAAPRHSSRILWVIAGALALAALVVLGLR